MTKNTSTAGWEDECKDASPFTALVTLPGGLKKPFTHSFPS